MSLLQGVQMGVGTWAWGDRLIWGYGSGYNDNDLQQAFDVSLGEGLNFFDTAESYGQGKSETLLGTFIANSKADVRVATKFLPYPWRLSRGSMLRALQASLRRLNLPSVDLYQMHAFMPPVSISTWMEAMADAYQRGLIRGVGVSNYNRDQTQQAYDALTRLGVPLAANQVEYHLLNRDIERNGLLQLCNRLGITVIAYSPLAMGLLTGKYSAEHPPSRLRGIRMDRNAIQQSIPLLQEMRKIGSAHGGKNPAQVALNWLLCKGTIPIPGAKNADQARQNAGALSWKLTEEEILRLDDLSERAVPTGLKQTG